jgi:DNA-binding FadR family transcriptional regulator
VHVAVLQSSATARHLIEARAHLEEQCASYAALRATDEDIQQMEVALDAFDNATSLVPKAQADIALTACKKHSESSTSNHVWFNHLTSIRNDASKPF